jgi:hypothetical protein
MKRAGLIVLGALLGLAFVFLMPFLSAWLSEPVQQGAPFSYDESNRQLKVYVLLGGGCFALIGAWIGHAAATSGRSAAAMAGAVLLGTVALKGLGAAAGMATSSAGQLAVVVAGWAALSAMLAFVAKRLLHKAGGDRLRPSESSS